MARRNIPNSGPFTLTRQFPGPARINAMASTILRCRPSLAAVSSTARQSFHSSSVVTARRDNKDTARARQIPFNLMDLEPSETEDDTTVAGHLMFRQHRQLLYHMRLIEHEMPKLVGEFHRPHHIRMVSSGSWLNSDHAVSF